MTTRAPAVLKILTGSGGGDVVVVRMMRSMWMVRLVRNLMVKTVKMVMMVGDLHGVGDAVGARSGLEAMCLTPSSPLGQSHEL